MAFGWFGILLVGIDFALVTFEFCCSAVLDTLVGLVLPRSAFGAGCSFPFAYFVGVVPQRVKLLLVFDAEAVLLAVFIGRWWCFVHLEFLHLAISANKSI